LLDRSLLHEDRAVELLAAPEATLSVADLLP
jgi:hypothetical protein